MRAGGAGRERAPPMRSESRSSSPRLLEPQELDERPQPVARCGHHDVRDAGRTEEADDLLPLRGGSAGESVADAGATCVDLELLARLWVDEPDGADVRQFLLARVSDLDRHDLVTRRESQQRAPPIERSAEVGDGDYHRSPPDEPRCAVARSTDEVAPTASSRG